MPVSTAAYFSRYWLENDSVCGSSTSSTAYAIAHLCYLQPISPEGMPHQSIYLRALLMVEENFCRARI
jgi:hypothetical protein